MQRSADRQKMLASHGALLSDERLPLVVLDMRKLRTLEGRVLAHGEEELGKGAGRHYLLLEGTDAKVHLIYYTPEMEEARSRGKLRANSFVRLQKQFENGRPVLEIEDAGDAERVLLNRTISRRESQGISRPWNHPSRRRVGRMAGSLPSRSKRIAAESRIWTSIAIRVLNDSALSVLQYPRTVCKSIVVTVDGGLRVPRISEPCFTDM